MKPALLLSLLLAAALASAGEAPRTLLVTGAGRGALVRDGKIVAVGEVADGAVGLTPVPPGTPRIDVEGGELGPGLIDAGALLAGSRPPERGVTADVRAADGFDPYADRRAALAAGVTTAAVDPGRARLVPGLSAVVRLAGGAVRDRVLVREAALHVVLTAAGRHAPRVYEPPVAPKEDEAPLEPAKVQLPTTLAGAALYLRELFATAAGGGGAQPEPGEVEPLGLPVLARARARELPVVFHADRAREIRVALSLARELGLRAILAGGAEAADLAAEIAAAGVPVVLDAGFRPGAMPANEPVEAIERRERALRAAAVLHRAGVPLCFRSSGDPADLPFLAARFLRPDEGFGRGELDAALTSGAARILGIGDRTGTLAPGMDADLVVRDGSGVALVLAAGEVVYRRPPADDLLVVRAGAVHVGDGTVLEDAGVLASGGRILEVGAVAAPGDAKVISAPVAVPGFIDAEGYLGLLDPGGAGRLPPSLSLATPPCGALAPGDPDAAPVLRAGITSYVAAPPGTGTVAGLGSLVHPSGGTLAEMVLVERAAVFFTLAGARDLPMTIARLGETLERGKDYAESFVRYGKAKAAYDAWVAGGSRGDERKPPSPPRRDPAREAWRALFAGRIPAVVRVKSEVEAREALALFSGRFDLSIVLSGAEEAWRLAPEMAEVGAAVLLGPDLVVGSGEGPRNLPAIYSRAGVDVLFGSRATTGAANLPADVAYAVHRGFGAGAALRALTSGAAERLGVADRIGAIRPGLAADLVLLSGPPFAPGTRVLAVVRGGRVVYREDSRGGNR